MQCHTACPIHPRLVFQLSSASFSTWKAAHRGTSAVFYFLWINHFSFTSPDTLSQAVFFSIFHFIHKTRNRKGKKKKKKGTNARKLSAMLLAMYVRASYFSGLFGSILTWDICVMAQSWWWYTNSPCMDEPCYIHTAFSNVKFWKFLLSMCKLHFFKGLQFGQIWADFFFTETAKSTSSHKTHLIKSPFLVPAWGREIRRGMLSLFQIKIARFQHALKTLLNSVLCFLIPLFWETAEPY